MQERNTIERGLRKRKKEEEKEKKKKKEEKEKRKGAYWQGAREKSKKDERDTYTHRQTDRHTTISFILASGDAHSKARRVRMVHDIVRLCVCKIK